MASGRWWPQVPGRGSGAGHLLHPHAAEREEEKAPGAARGAAGAGGAKPGVGRSGWGKRADELRMLRSRTSIRPR